MIKLSEIAGNPWSERLLETHGEIVKEEKFFNNITTLSKGAKIADIESYPYISQALKDEMDYLANLWVCKLYDVYSGIYPIDIPELLECLEEARTKVLTQPIPKLKSNITYSNTTDIALALMDTRINGKLLSVQTSSEFTVEQSQTFTPYPYPIQTNLIFSCQYTLESIEVSSVLFKFCMAVAGIAMKRMFDNSIDGVAKIVSELNIDMETMSYL